ncbi:hypothetical protein K458DRAFT_55743 [Lentithecium fluviatile CBS 122367]|uniref:Uncharacterized protein n=1 Tax=Lentithecium fluviatile CBS 122367 TaxID=1168545 RepID=A0A6G1IX37_9PLEO|nr:hypothetical protein K458DRAFT_55743 [Lentithecium fluviatile CBS 122367]
MPLVAVRALGTNIKIAMTAELCASKDNCVEVSDCINFLSTCRYPICLYPSHTHHHHQKSRISNQIPRAKPRSLR